MAKWKFTKEGGNERLDTADRTVRIIEAGKTVNDKSLFQCLVCLNEWETDFNHVWSGGRGCPLCALKNSGLGRRIPESECYKRIENRTLNLIYYAGTTHGLSRFECKICLYTWDSTFQHVEYGSGCPKCSGVATLTLKDCIERLEGRPLKIIHYSGKTGSSSKSVFKCSICFHTWSTSFNNIDQGQGCPICAKSGFNSTKPTWVYILLLDTPQGYCYGFGITNRLEGRMKLHKRSLGTMLSTEYDSLYFDNGKLALELETKWKQSPYVVDIGVPGFKTECVLVNSETTKMIFG